MSITKIFVYACTSKKNILNQNKLDWENWNSNIDKKNILSILLRQKQCSRDFILNISDNKYVLKNKAQKEISDTTIQLWKSPIVGNAVCHAVQLALLKRSAWFFWQAMWHYIIKSRVTIGQFISNLQRRRIDWSKTRGTTPSTTITILL